MSVRRVRIHYRRLPHRVQLFDQPVLVEEGGCVVTFAPSVELERPVRAGTRTILEPGAPVVWFTWPGRPYDVGRFHLADGTFTGLYANVLTPVRMDGDRWETTDLCLDVWAGTDGAVEILDREELAHALREGWIDPAAADEAAREAEALAALARRGAWPPAPVAEWDLERARRRMRELENEP